MARKRTADNDAPPPRRSNRIQELAQRTTAQESQSKPLVPKKSKTANPRVKKVTSTEKPSAKPSTARKAATVTVRKGNSTGRNVKRKIEEPQPENATSEEDISTLPKRDTLPSGNVKPHNGELILRTAVFVSDLRSSDFGDLYKLVITSDIWKKLPEDDNGVLSIPTLTELELRGVTFPGARRALMFVMSFPKLKKLALDDVRVSSDVEFEDEEMENLLQKIGGPTPNLLSLWIGNIDDSDVNPAFHLFYNIIVEVAIDSLEDLYVHRYEPALEIVRSSVSLNRLHLHLAREPKDYITAVALCHISDVQLVSTSAKYRLQALNWTKRPSWSYNG
ncbi:hypothetical protein BDZ89DRAFT_647848 [Hymenopellis radicata]|nr:hypothetical protein BDZ89DRAFT_647848 [Hymenopellis radicata]